MDIKISALALLVIFAVCEAKLTPAQRLTALRNEMATRGYNAAIIPTEDEHQSEYVAEYDLRREWLTGFTGSAGTAVVTKDKALLWTDSRYYLQAEKELKGTEWILMKSSDSTTPRINAWLVSELNDGDKVGQSSKFVSINTWTGRESDLKVKHITLENTDPDLVDSIWPSDERAPKPKSDIKIHDLKFAGKTWQQKVEDVKKRLNSESVDMFVVTALDEVAWLFNLRASDIPYNPMVFAYAIIHKETNAQHEFYIDMERVDQKLRDHLNGAEIRDYTSITNDIRAYSEIGKKIWISPMSSYAIYGSVTNKDNMLMKSSPIRSMKARKTDIEMENNRRCHLRDSVARVRHMYWLETEMAKGERITEWSSAERLEEFQKEDDLFHMLSFDSISAVGANAAIIHYSIDREEDVALEKSKIYLLDAGAQYDDCTTDITRTLHFGQPTYKERYAYTRVLQGSIDLANIVFPPNVYARELDAEARIALWRTGLDYGHGTGHGIGYYLSVHEDPPSTGGGSYDETLEKGMIMSDEPGYYEDGSFGIRLETDIEVVNAKTPYNFRGRQYLKFEPLTFVPFERKLIDECLLTNEQVDWMNKYYQEIDEKVAPKLTSRQEKDFLMEKTKRFKYSYQLPFCSQFDPDATDDSSASKITFSFSVFITVLSAIYVQYFA